MRKFSHLGVEWEVDRTGIGHGVGSGSIPAITSWGVRFESVFDPARTYLGRTHHPDLSAASDEDLRASLESAIADAEGTSKGEPEP